MSDSEMNAEQICQAVVANTMTAREAEERLVALGYCQATAREEIFIALGGDDVIEDDAQRRRNIVASRRH